MTGTPVRRHRVFLYITHRERILVLRHVDYPELGLQIPGGTVEPGEHPAAAACREAWEETGLDELSAPRFLGRDTLASQRRNEAVIEAWFFQLQACGQPDDAWRHVEAFASDEPGPLVFELFWLSLGEASEQLGVSDRMMLDRLD